MKRTINDYMKALGKDVEDCVTYSIPNYVAEQSVQGKTKIASYHLLKKFQHDQSLAPTGSPELVDVNKKISALHDFLEIFSEIQNYKIAFPWAESHENMTNEDVEKSTKFASCANIVCQKFEKVFKDEIKIYVDRKKDIENIEERLQNL